VAEELFLRFLVADPPFLVFKVEDERVVDIFHEVVELLDTLRRHFAPDDVVIVGLGEVDLLFIFRCHPEEPDSFFLELFCVAVGYEQGGLRLVILDVVIGLVFEDLVANNDLRWSFAIEELF